MSNKPLIAIVDDDETVRTCTADLVNSMGFRGRGFEDAEDFLKSDALHSTDCLIADMRMPGMSGLELHIHLVASGNAVPTILITAFPNDRDRNRARQSGVRCYLAKPFADHELLECVRSALEARPAR
jgi:FixJ family two-component response regulator